MSVAYVLIALLCFSAFYLLLDCSQKKCKSEAIGLNAVSFCAGTAVSIVSAGGIHTGQFPAALLLVGGLIGVTAGVGLLGITLSIRSGVMITVVNTAASLSLAVPIVLSLAIYGEVPSLRKALGLGLAGLAIFLIQRGRQ